MPETQETVCRWIDETFPGADPESPRKALRALEEMIELCLAAGASPEQVADACRKIIHEALPQLTAADWTLTAPAPEKIPAEAADVLIVLYGLAGLRGFDLHDEVDRKMAINRARRWAPRGDGTGYHIRNEQPARPLSGASGPGGGCPMRIYLAARYSRRRELCGYADQLRRLGHEVTSRWLDGHHELLDREGLSTEAEAADRARFAAEDWADVMRADWCISFTEVPRSGNGRGGRHVEFGAALAAGKRAVIVGPRENVFHCLPAVRWYPDWKTFMADHRGDAVSGERP
jgi:hypothetical protein